MAAIINEIATAGPATLCATIPATGDGLEIDETEGKAAGGGRHGKECMIIIALIIRRPHISRSVAIS